jgi:hypothetical protein
VRGVKKMKIYIAASHGFHNTDDLRIASQECWKINQGLNGRLVSYYYISSFKADKKLFEFWKRGRAKSKQSKQTGLKKKRKDSP